MKQCYVCDTALSPLNETEEHIIINAAGGRLKSKDLICRSCNSKFGEKIDSELAKQLNSIANMLMIKRYRGEPQPIIAKMESTGEKYLLDVGGTPKINKPSIEIIGDDSQTKFMITARSESEMKRILEGIANKYASLNVDEAMQHSKKVNDFIDEPLQFRNEIGGADVFRAVCKCAVNFFVYKTSNVAAIKHLIPYIQGEEDKNIVCMHYAENVYEIEPDEAFHVIHVVGSSPNRILYCYVDYFNSYKYLILLSEEYTGNSFEESYCYDLLGTKEVNKTINITYDRETIMSLLADKSNRPFERITNCFDRTMALAVKRQSDRQRESLLEQAVQHSLGKYPDGVEITEEMRKEVVDEIIKEMIPYLTRTLKE